MGRATATLSRGLWQRVVLAAVLFALVGPWPGSFCEGHAAGMNLSLTPLLMYASISCKTRVAMYACELHRTTRVLCSLVAAGAARRNVVRRWQCCAEAEPREMVDLYGALSLFNAAPDPSIGCVRSAHVQAPIPHEDCLLLLHGFV